MTSSRRREVFVSTQWGLFSETTARVEREEKRDDGETKSRGIPVKRGWKRRPKERGCQSLSHHLPKKTEQKSKEGRERSGEGMIRRSEMCDDMESTKGFRARAVLPGAYYGQVPSPFRVWSCPCFMRCYEERIWKSCSSSTEFLHFKWLSVWSPAGGIPQTLESLSWPANVFSFPQP